jgi:hypothetical protein
MKAMIFLALVWISKQSIHFGARSISCGITGVALAITCFVMMPTVQGACMHAHVC